MIPWWLDTSIQLQVTKWWQRCPPFPWPLFFMAELCIGGMWAKSAPWHGNINFWHQIQTIHHSLNKAFNKGLHIEVWGWITTIWKIFSLDNIVNLFWKKRNNSKKASMNRSRSKGRLMETAFISKTNSSTEDLDEVDRYYRPMVITLIGGDGALQNTALHQIDHFTDL